METIFKPKTLNSKLLILNSRRGFTFVELLVVVTIIVLLSAIGLASYSQVNKKARDSKRKSDLEQIRTALEIYRTDQGSYPASGAGDGSLDLSCTTGSETLKSSDGTRTYMDPIPCDPKSDQTYVYTPSAAPITSYTLQAELEIVAVCEGTCACTGDNTYCVKQP
jgi:general secretion pathway protein G